MKTQKLPPTVIIRRMAETGQRRQTHPPQLPEVMTIGDLASYLQVSKSSLYKLAQEGRVPCQKVGKHWRFRKETIDRWLDEQEEASEETDT